MSFSVIIPSRNPDNLAACVASIKENEVDPKIIVVDDGLLRIPEGITALKGMKPFIFSRNVNLAILAAQGDDVILMNDDTRLLTKNGFSELARVGLDYGITSAAITDAVGNPNQLRRRNSGVRLELSRSLAFVCIFIPRTTLFNVGLLDERFKEYGWEDNDYCRRVIDAGLTLAIFDGCLVEHGRLPSTFRSNGGGDIRPGRQIYIEKWGDAAR